MTRIVLMVVSVIVTLFVGESQAGTVEVSPKGSVRTLGAALELTRAMTNENREIVLHGGDYFGTCATLDTRDNGLVIRNVSGERPVLWGGVPVAGWRKMSDGPCWRTLVPLSVATNARALLVNGVSRPRARYPESGTLLYTNVCVLQPRAAVEGYWDRKPTLEEQTHLRYKREDIPESFDFRSADVSAYHLWLVYERAITAHDRATGTFVLGEKTGSPLGAYGVRKYVIWNTAEGMTGPGRWRVDRTSGEVFYWPQPGEDIGSVQIVIPEAMAILRVAGTAKAPVKNVIIEGLALKGTTVPLVKEGWIGSSYEGAVTFAHTEGLELRGLEISEVAGNAIAGIRPWNTANFGTKILNCRISQTGSGGIYIRAKNGLVEGNRITDTGRMFCSGVGIACDGEDIVFRGNFLANLTYSGVSGGGTRFLFENNVVTNYMTVLGDGAGMYLSRAKQCVMRGNSVDTCGNPEKGWSGYYLDELSEGNIIERNTSRNVEWPVHNHIATNTIVRNNIFRHTGPMKFTFQRSGGISFIGNTVESGGDIVFPSAEGVTNWQGNILHPGATHRVIYRTQKGKILPAPTP